MELLYAYNDLSKNLIPFLKKFEESKQEVTKEDIEEFFDGLKKKRRKLQ